MMRQSPTRTRKPGRPRSGREAGGLGSRLPGVGKTVLLMELDILASRARTIVSRTCKVVVTGSPRRR